MPAWYVHLTPEAQEDLKRLDKQIRRRIFEKLVWFEKHFDTINPSLLGGPWKGFFKFRVGRWRVIYTVAWDRSSIWIVLIDLRDRIYKRLSYARH